MPLTIKNLSVSVGSRKVIDNISLDIIQGHIHALMGPNGSGKSSLAYAIMGHPEYAVTSGSIFLNGKDITGLKPEERAAEGLFLSFQEPPEVGGVTMKTFLSTIGETSKTDAILPSLNLPDSFLHRFLNEGFSGGKKKKSEILQLVSRHPAIAILDEIDSGLDIDSLKGVAVIIKKLLEAGTGILLITHSPRLFKLLKPDELTILLRGRIRARGNAELLEILESRGYEALDS